MTNPLNQNPTEQWCVDCGDIADEFFEDEWLCEDCICQRMEKDEI